MSVSRYARFSSPQQLRHEPARRRSNNRVAIYVRVASFRQGDGDLAVQEQLRANLAYCEQRSWIVVGEYIDLGASGIIDGATRIPENASMMHCTGENSTSSSSGTMPGYSATPLWGRHIAACF